MTEKEKQQAGELYDANDRELFTERVKARKLCSEFNSLEYNDFQKKERLIDRIVALKGENVTIESNFLCNYGYNIVIGNNFHADFNCIMIDNAEITFGDNIYIGANCCFCTAERPVDAETRNSGLERAKPIRVGNNVSFGNNVTVAAGITIGDNVVIGPGSAVTKDVPSNCKAFGNPCLPTKVLQESSKSSFEKKTEDKPAAPASAAAPAQNRPGAPTAPQQNRPAAPASPSMPSLNRPADPAAPQQNRPGAPTAPQQNRPMGTRHIEVRRVEPTNNNNNSNNNNNNNGFPDRRK